MSDYNIKISELNPFPTASDAIRIEDFFPMVNSSSMTTYRTTIQDIGSLITHSIYADTASYLLNYKPTISASWASASISASYAVTASYAISASHANVADSASYYPPQSLVVSCSWASRSLQSWYATRSIDVDTYGVQYNFPYWTSNIPGAGNGDLQQISPLVYLPTYNSTWGLLAVDSASTLLTSYYPYPIHRPDFQYWQYLDTANAVFGILPNAGIQSRWPITSHMFTGTDNREWHFASSSINSATNSYYSGSAGDASSGSFYTIPLVPGALASVFNGKWVRFISDGNNQNNYGDNSSIKPIADHASMGEPAAFPGQIMKGLISLQAQTMADGIGSGAWSQIDLWVHCGGQGGNGNPSATIFHVHNQVNQLIRSFRIVGLPGGGPDPTFAMDMLIDGLSQKETQFRIAAQSWQGIRFLKWLNVDPWPVVNTGSNDITQDSTQLIFPAAPGYYSNAPKALNYYIQGKPVVIWPTSNDIIQSGLSVPANASTQSLYVSGGINTNNAFYCDNNKGITTKVTYGTTNLYFSGGILINKYPPDVVPTGSTGQPCGSGLKFTGGKAMPNTMSVNLGSSTGPVLVHYNMYTPDRLQVYLDNTVVLDTGYRGASSYSASLNAALATYRSASAPIVGPGSGTLSFQKNTTSTTAYLQVFSPIAGTNWNLTMSCPNQPLP